MQISPETVSVLKNFSSINQGLEFKKGHVLRTISQGRSVLGQVTLSDEFPQDFCVYDLNQFLSIYSLFKGQVALDFDKNDIIFKTENRKVRFRTSQKNMIHTPDERQIKLPSVDLNFTLSVEDYEWLMKSANVLSSPHIGIISDGDEVQLSAFDAAESSAHTNSIRIGGGNGHKYRMVYKTENLKLMPHIKYSVDVSFAGISHYTSLSDTKIEYWISFEPTLSSIDK